MATAQCRNCLGIANGETFEIAKSSIDHSIGLRIQRPCINNPAYIIEIFDEKPPKIISPPKIITEPKKVEPIIQAIPKNIKPHSVKPKKQTKPSKKQSIQ